MGKVGSSIAPKGSQPGKMVLGLGSNVAGEEAVGGSDVERGDAARIASIPPARVPIPSDSPVIQVSCGLHHTGKFNAYIF